MKKQTKPKRKYTKKNSVPVVDHDMERFVREMSEVHVRKNVVPVIETYNTKSISKKEQELRQNLHNILMGDIQIDKPDFVKTVSSENIEAMEKPQGTVTHIDEFNAFIGYNRNRSKQMFQLIVALFWTLPILFYYLVFGL